MWTRRTISVAALWLLTAAAGQVDPRSFDSRLLSAHNAERVRKFAPPLIWSPALARDAAAWATTLANSGKFEHAPQRNSGSPQGENLWMGTQGAYAPEEMVQSWIDEKSDYRRGLFPNVSRTGNWSDVGHYTQLIWGDTKEVGCARASNGADDYLVCRYFPAGNWIGVDPERNLKSQQIVKPQKRNPLARNKN